MNDEAGARLTTWLDSHTLIENHDDDVLVHHGEDSQTCAGCAWQRAMAEVFADLRALLAEREQLAARVAELPIAVAVDFRKATEDDVRTWREALNAAAAEERDADVRAVARLLKALGDDMLVSQAGLDEPAAAALVALQERFAKPIAALDARTTDGGTK